jgi:hypothetical protein
MPKPIGSKSKSSTRSRSTRAISMKRTRPMGTPRIRTSRSIERRTQPTQNEILDEILKSNDDPVEVKPPKQITDLPNEILDKIFKSYVPLEMQQPMRSVSAQFKSLLPDIRITKNELNDFADLLNETIGESILFLYPKFIQHVYDQPRTRFILLNPENTKVFNQITINKTEDKPMKIMVKRKPLSRKGGDGFIKTIRDTNKWLDQVATTIDDEILELVLEKGEDYVYILADPIAPGKNVEELKAAMKTILLDKINDPNYVYPFDNTVTPQLKNELNSFLDRKIDKLYRFVTKKLKGQRITDYEKKEYLQMIIEKLQEYGDI